ncbi:hypothetical protein NQ318_015797 [Aromia moschata]|uniref:Uncharacterized protein n=1 Tax=Aromia moschata TaxID=1265417 RepID=A0AAV8XGG9_9CUCU|nr:hypothetical protein NQ318_015797 [Aromia moschata]
MKQNLSLNFLFEEEEKTVNPKKPINLKEGESKQAEPIFEKIGEPPGLHHPVLPLRPTMQRKEHSLPVRLHLEAARNAGVEPSELRRHQRHRQSLDRQSEAAQLHEILQAGRISGHPVRRSHEPEEIPRANNQLPANLATIDMSGNNITNVPTKVHRIAPKLTKLLLSSNRIVVPKKKPLMVSKTLRTLMLSDNGIRNVYKFTFARLPALEVLYLDSNELKFVTPAMFSPVKNLKYLHLGQNYMVKVPPKSAMPKSIVYYITKGQRKIKRDLRRKSRKNHKRDH